MKDLKTLLEGSLLADVEDTLSVNAADIAKSAIHEFIRDNYVCDTYKISNKPNKNGFYEVTATSDVHVYNRELTTLTNDLFIWKNVKKSFYCSYCTNLKSLEGAPESVGLDFNCSYCTNLKSLEGAPNRVGLDFCCNDCMNLISLKGSPKIVKNDFICIDCNKLESLNGAPKSVGGEFNCKYCKIEFTLDDVKFVCNVKGKIYV